MSAVIGYVDIGAGRAIAVDNNAGLFLIESDRRTATIGLAGDGPCAIRRVASFAIIKDTLFVLDNRQGRIIGYYIPTGDCVADVTRPNLTEFDGLSRVGGWYYLVATKYTSATPVDRPLLYRMDDTGEPEPLDLAVGDLEADRLLVSIQFGRRTRQIRVKDGMLYFLLPLSHRVWRFDTRSGEVSHVSLSHDSPDISSHSESADPKVISEVMSRLEAELDLFLLEDHFAVLSNFRSRWRVGLYSYVGDLIAKGEVPHHVDFESGGRFYSLKETESEPNIYEILDVEPLGR